MEYSVFDDRNGKLAYQIHGVRGADYIFIHGSNQSSRIFEPLLLSPLAKNCRIITVDLPGHGRSGAATDWSLPAVALQINRLLKDLRIENPTVLGCSLGGHVATHLLTTNSVIKALWLLSTPPATRPLDLASMYQTSDLFQLLYKLERTEQENWQLAHAMAGPIHATAALADLKAVSSEFRREFPATFIRGEHADELELLHAFQGELHFAIADKDVFTKNSYVEALDLPYKQVHRFDCSHSILPASHEEVGRLVFKEF